MYISKHTCKKKCIYVQPYSPFYKPMRGTSLVVQWLRFCTLYMGGLHLIPDWGTRCHNWKRPRSPFNYVSSQSEQGEKGGRICLPAAVPHWSKILSTVFAPLHLRVIQALVPTGPRCLVLQPQQGRPRIRVGTSDAGASEALLGCTHMKWVKALVVCCYSNSWNRTRGQSPRRPVGWKVQA